MNPAKASIVRTVKVWLRVAGYNSAVLKDVGHLEGEYRRQTTLWPIFTLSEVSATKGDRDFSDFLSVELRDEHGQLSRPEKIWDINGQRKDVVASFNNLPQGTQIKHVRIVALQELQGGKIRWCSGSLKYGRFTRTIIGQGTTFLRCYESSAGHIQKPKMAISIG